LVLALKIRLCDAATFTACVASSPVDLLTATAAGDPEYCNISAVAAVDVCVFGGFVRILFSPSPLPRRRRTSLALVEVLFAQGVTRFIFKQPHAARIDRHRSGGNRCRATGWLINSVS